MKPIEEFNWKIKDVKRSADCKACHRIYRRKHYVENHEKYKAKARKWIADNGGGRFIAYGVTDEAYEELLDRYGGKCWICRVKPAEVIDHDHSCCPDSKKTCGACVRGLLCRGCNTGLGIFRDSVEIMQRAIYYVQAGPISGAPPAE